ncbi:hypothetical protein [Duganella sp. LjRoot269]|jgi:hypothetical protein|uniref:hypothetical protein n=1 Tax=Duganella sp. LjRoot269 TaxID=3342305 RepID=UPI003ED06616
MGIFARFGVSTDAYIAPDPLSPAAPSRSAAAPAVVPPLSGHVYAQASAPPKKNALQIKLLATLNHTSSAGIRNLDAASAAKTMVREDFYTKEGNFKSANKYSAKKAWSEEKPRLLASNSAVKQIRAVKGDRPAMVRAALASKGHNCFDLSLIAQDYLRSSGKQAILGGTPDHVFVVVGAIEPGPMPKDMTKWPQDLAICDPWANIACLAKDYPEKFTEKMGKWDSKEKFILDKDVQHLSPTSDQWLKRQLEGDKDVGDA